VLGQVYEIATNAAFEAAQVCLNYEDGNLADESLVRLFHEEGGAWVDVTDAGYPDTSLNKVCGTVTSFSPFAAGLTLNSAPSNVVVASLAEPQQAGTSITAFASFDDPDQGDTHTFTWDWGDGSALEVGAQSAVHAYATPGVYTITVTVADAAGASAEGTSQFVVIYDPDGGFVTGGGWINSPLGAYAANPSLTGKATFGFVSKYLKGATVPSGNTEFQFKVADFSFKSTSYDWLVVAGAKAQFKGSGTINGAGDYGFMLTATDGQVSGGGEADKFRIKIWDKATGDAIYDNQMGEINDALPATELQGGSIVVHK
jgi:PKD repeat protein